MKFQAEIDGETIDLEIEDNTFKAGEKSAEYSFSKENGRYYLRVGTKLYKIDNVSYEGADIEFSIDGNWKKVSVKDEQELLLDRLGFKTGAAAAEGEIKAPMPGKILEIMVKEGDEVTKDQPVAILEAMKMENELKSTINGVVEKIHAEAGQSLEKNSLILEIEAVG